MERYTITMGEDSHAPQLQFQLDHSNRGVQREIAASIKSGVLYEPEICYFLMRVLQKGDFFIDIGANVGFFTVFGGCLVGETGKVFAFEPDRNNFSALEQHVSINELSQVTCNRRVVCEKCGSRTFFLNKDADGGHALWDVGVFPRNVKSKEQPQTIQVEATTIDATLEALSPRRTPKIIKIDTEGAEHAVLKGAERTLKQAQSSGHFVPFVICELHAFGLKQLGSSPYLLRGYMHELGYETFLLFPQSQFPKLVPLEVELKSQYILNVLFSRVEWLRPYFPVEVVDERGKMD